MLEIKFDKITGDCPAKISLSEPPPYKVFNQQSLLKITTLDSDQDS